MKRFLPSFVALTILLTTTSASVHAQALSQSIFVERPEVIYPIPTDDDVVHPIGKASKSQLPAKNISFLVWNLYKGANDTFKPEYLALTFNRDIIMNQEIFLDQKMNDVFRYMPQYLFETATSFFSGKERIRTGLANISSVQSSFTQFVRTQTLEPVVNSPKLALITSYPIRFSTKKLTVVNIHGINFVSTKSFRLELHRIYEAIKDIPSPLVFAGDFNTWNADRIAILQEYATKLGLQEARFLPDNRMTFNGYPLDHFLHTSDLKIKKARVDSIYKGSDHKPLTVEAEFIRLKSDIDYEYPEYQEEDQLAQVFP